MKVNVALDVETVNQLEDITDKVKKERRLGQRERLGPGRPIGVGNIVADIFERAWHEHPEWIDEWYKKGLIDVEMNQSPFPIGGRYKVSNDRPGSEAMEQKMNEKRPEFKRVRDPRKGEGRREKKRTETQTDEENETDSH